MVMTILEAHVPAENWDALEQAYGDGIKEQDPGLVQTFLLHASSDPTIWRIATVWESREALAKMRQMGTPRGVLMFRAAGAEPTLMVFDIVSSMAAT